MSDLKIGGSYDPDLISHYASFQKIKLRQLVSIGDGVYMIEKIPVHNLRSAAALREIHNRIASGDILIKESGHYAARGIEDREIKQILSKKFVDGKEVVKDVTSKHALHSMSEEEFDQFDASFLKAIDLLEQVERDKSKEPTKIKGTRSPLKVPVRKADEVEIRSVYTPKKVQELMFEQNIAKQEASRRRRHREKVAREKAEEKAELRARNIKEDQLKWDIQQENIKQENIKNEQLNLHPHHPKE